MATPAAAPRKIAIYLLIAAGFAGLIGAHELAVTPPQPGAQASMIVPFILAAVGTLCFVAAGLMARKLMRQDGSK